MTTRDTMLKIARDIILHRAAWDGCVPEEYDPVTDDEGFVISLLTALRHWCHAQGIDWRADLDQAEMFFREDLTESDTPS